MFKRLHLFVFILLPTLLVAQDTSFVAQLKDKVNRYLDKEHALDGYYLIDTSGVSIFETPEAKANGLVEYKVFWDEVGEINRLFKRFTSEELLHYLQAKKDRNLLGTTRSEGLLRLDPPLDHPLKGIRIALDPGHMATTMEEAKMEKKFIEMKANEKTGLKKDISLIEAQLTFETTALLKIKLEEQGGIVLLTRPNYHGTAFEIDFPPSSTAFDQWMRTSFKAATDTACANQDITEEEKQFLLNQASKKEIFRKLFTSLETKERARKINAFNPDFTIIIHYNVDEKNLDWAAPTKKNFDMTFVSGSFMKDELEKPINRAEFLRLIISPDIKRSIKFSSYFIKSFEKNLQVPTAQFADADYLQHYSLPTEKPGVYCRNLALTRLVHGTLVYGETLYQDNESELRALSKKTIQVNGVQTSERVQQVASAYYEAILNYLSKGKE